MYAYFLPPDWYCIPFSLLMFPHSARGFPFCFPVKDYSSNFPVVQVRLQGEGGTSGANDSSLDLGRAEEGELVGDRAGGDGTFGGVVGSTVKSDVLDDGVADLVAVKGGDGLGATVLEGGALDEDLSAHAGVDAGDLDVGVEVVVDVDGAEPDGGETAAQVAPIVVGVGDVKVALVLRRVAVGVADEGDLVVVVKVGVGDGDPLGAVVDIDTTVVEVLVGSQVGGNLNVVNPDVLGGLDGNAITVGGLDLGDLQVSDDDVVGLVDLKTDAVQGWHGVLAHIWAKRAS